LGGIHPTVMFLPTLLYLSLAYVTWTFVAIVQNYRIARQIGLPTVFIPFDVTSVIWYLLRHPISSLALKLPFGWGDWGHRMHGSWTYRARYKLHAKYGPAFAEVSPARVKVFVADDEGVEDLLKRNNDYIKDPAIYGALELFGANVSTSFLPHKAPRVRMSSIHEL
jgi:hypothetical protein